MSNKWKETKTRTNVPKKQAFKLQVADDFGEITAIVHLDTVAKYGHEVHVAITWTN